MIPLQQGMVDRWAAWVAEQRTLQSWVKDVRSRFISVSEPLAQWCGVRPEEMIGQTEREFWPDQRVLGFRRDDRMVLALAIPLMVEESSPRGRYSTLKRPLGPERRQVLGTVGISREWPAGTVPAPLEMPESERRDDDGPEWLRRVREEIEQHAPRSVNLATLARRAGRHPNHLSREFRRWYGVPATEWLQRLRIAAAADLLATTGDPLGCIAAQSGFADQPHFTRVFKQFLGITPQRYRAAVALPSCIRNGSAPGMSDEQEPGG
jgi:AraC-like DNA-binding protein